MAHAQLLLHPRLSAATARCLATVYAYRWGHALATNAEGRAGVEEPWYRDKHVPAGHTAARDCLSLQPAEASYRPGEPIMDSVC